MYPALFFCAIRPEGGRRACTRGYLRRNPHRAGAERAAGKEKVSADVREEADRIPEYREKL